MEVGKVTGTLGINVQPWMAGLQQASAALGTFAQQSTQATGQFTQRTAHAMGTAQQRTAQTFAAMGQQAVRSGMIINQAFQGLQTTATRPIRGLATGFQQGLGQMAQATTRQVGHITQIFTRLGQETSRITSMNELLGASFHAPAARVRALQTALQGLLRQGLSPMSPQVLQLAQSLQTAQRQMTTFGSSISGLLAPLRGLGVLIGVGTIVQVGRDMASAAIAAETLEAQFYAVTGSVQAAQAEMAFARAVTERLGLSFLEMTLGLAKIEAAAMAANLPIAEARLLWVAVAEAATAFRLSVADTSGILTAFSQILSKSIVSSEELRGQIGERLFGAFAIAAKAMGVTTEKLVDLLERGMIPANDFAMRMARALREWDVVQRGVTAGAASATAEFNRLRNAYRDFLTALAEVGIIQAATVAMQGLTAVIRDLGAAFGLLSRTPAQGAMTAITTQLQSTAHEISVLEQQLQRQAGQDPSLFDRWLQGIFGGPETSIEQRLQQLKEAQTALKGVQEQLGGTVPSVEQTMLPPPTPLPPVSLIDTKGAARSAKRAEEIWQDLDRGRIAIQQMGQALGAAFDQPAELLNLLQRSFENLVEEGINPATPRMRALRDEIQALSGSLPASGFARDVEKINLAAQVLGPSFDAAGQRLSAFESQIQAMASRGVTPGADALATLRQQFVTLTQEASAAELARQLTGLTLQEQLFHDTLATGEGRVTAYRQVIDGLLKSLGDEATPIVADLKRELDAVEGSLARQAEAARMGEAYQLFAASIQEVETQFAIWGDENTRVQGTLSALTTLLQTLTSQGLSPTADALAAVVEQIRALQLPDLDRLLAPVQRQQEVFGGAFFADPTAQFEETFSAIRQELSRLAADPSIDLHNEKVQQLIATYNELSIVSELSGLAISFGHELASSFEDAIFNGEELSDVLNALVEDIARITLRWALMQAIMGGIGLFQQAFLPGVGATPIASAQHGGFFPNPALVQTHGQEWVLNRQQMAGLLAGRQGGQATVNVYNNMPGAQARTEEREGSKGEQQIDVFIDQMVAGQIGKAGSRSARAVRQLTAPPLIAR